MSVENMTAGGRIWTKVPVRIIGIERRRGVVRDAVLVELPDGRRKTVRAGEVLVVEAEVNLEREGGNV